MRDNTKTHSYLSAGRRLKSPQLQIHYDDGAKLSHSLHNTEVRHATAVPTVYMLLADRLSSDINIGEQSLRRQSQEGPQRCSEILGDDVGTRTFVPWRLVLYRERALLGDVRHRQFVCPNRRCLSQLGAVFKPIFARGPEMIFCLTWGSRGPCWQHAVLPLLPQACRQEIVFPKHPL